MNSTTLQTRSVSTLAGPQSFGVAARLLAGDHRSWDQRSLVGPLQGRPPVDMAALEWTHTHARTHTLANSPPMGCRLLAVTRSLRQLRPTSSTQLPEWLLHMCVCARPPPIQAPSTNGTCSFQANQVGSRANCQRRSASVRPSPSAFALAPSQTRSQTNTRPPLARSHSSSSTPRDGIRAVPHLSKSCLPQCISGVRGGRQAPPAPSVERLRNKFKVYAVRTQNGALTLALVVARTHKHALSASERADAVFDQVQHARAYGRLKIFRPPKSLKSALDSPTRARIARGQISVRSIFEQVADLILDFKLSVGVPTSN